PDGTAALVACRDGSAANAGQLRGGHARPTHERRVEGPRADDEVQQVVRWAFEVREAKGVRLGRPGHHEAVDPEEETDDADNGDEPLLHRRISQQERSSDGDDAEADVRDVLAGVQVEPRRVRLGEHREQADHPQAYEDRAADLQELLGIGVPTFSDPAPTLSRSHGWHEKTGPAARYEANDPLGSLIAADP